MDKGGKMVDSRLEEMRLQTWEFHKKHPEVWSLFVRFTFEIINRGFQNYSVNAIFERIRWEKDIGGDGINQFKLNNNYTAFYARKFMDMFPEHKGFFRTRTQTSEDKKATKQEPLRPAYFNSFISKLKGATA